MWGIDRLSSGQFSSLRKRLRSQSCAVLTHAAAVDRRGRHALDVLAELGVEPRVIFTPEHGFHAVAQAEEAVENEQREGPPLVSLYGTNQESLRPTPQHLEGIDVLVIDLADIGSRYYTYVWTALLAARAAREQGIHTVILDRPNPLSGRFELCEGKPQEPGYTSFVGLEPIPIRHGLTIGEVVSYFLAQDGAEVGPEGALSVVSCWGWERHRTAEAWGRPFISPSPNMPSLETALLYPGACLLEGTNLSEGRGTSFPFRVLGAPFLDGDRLTSELTALHLPGVWFRSVQFRPSWEKHAGSLCAGLMLHVTDARSFRPVTTFLTILSLVRRQSGEQLQFLERPYEFETAHPAFDLLTGSSTARQLLLADADVEAVIDAVVPVPTDYREFTELAEARVQAAQA